jgi:2-methylcitrate dehydratase PrpD
VTGERTDRIDPLVEQAAKTRTVDIPPAVLERAAELFADTVGCVFAGTGADGMETLRQAMLAWGGNQQATVLGPGHRTSAPMAALLNAAAGHARDFDDTHDDALNHGCVTVVPALLATVETLGPGRAVTGDDFLAALAVGLEVSNRLGMAFIPYLHPGWLPTTLWGPFGCAAACGRLLGLDTAGMHHAFGFAHARSHGNRQALCDGALAKRIQPGFSASAGLEAAFLAARGLSAARHVIDGMAGLPALYTGGRLDERHLADGLGAFEQTLAVSIKPYPSCRCTHPVIDAALRVKKEHGVPWQDIEHGVIRLAPSAMAQVGKPFSIRANPAVDAQFSAPYTAALVFTRGVPRIGDFLAGNIRSRRAVAALAGRFTCEEFEKGSAALVPVELSVTLKDGRRLEARVETPRGSVAVPLSRRERNEKFADCLACAEPPYPEAAAREILETVTAVRSCDDVAAMVSSLPAAPAAP